MLKWESTLFLTISHIRYEILPKQLETYEKYCKIIQWGRANPTKFMEEFMNLEFLDHQKYIFLNAWRADVSVILASRSSGKALDLNTKVYPVYKDGPKTIKDIKVGDLIYNEKGEPTKVIKLNPIIFDNYYEVTFNDGEVIKCNGEHLWTVYQNGKYCKKGQTREELSKILYTISTERMSKNFKLSSGSNRYFVPLNSPIQYEKKKYLIEPYLFGLWISDGNKKEGYITCEAKDVDEQIKILESINENNWFFSKRKRGDNFIDIIINHKDDTYNKIGKRSRSIFLDKLKELGVYKNKFIPEEYLYGSVQQRLELIQGLYDADATISKNGDVTFAQKNLKVIRQIECVLSSLGIKYAEYFKKYFDDRTDKEYSLYNIRTHKDIGTPFFKLKRKLEKQNNVIYSISKKAIIDIKKINKKIAMRCITVDNDTGLFLCGEKRTVTHNSYLATPFIMARSLLFPNHNSYLMAPSGQQSQMLFQKMEDLAKGQIASAIGVSSFFLDECVRMNAKADPFTHSKQSFTVELYNGSTINTLNSVAKNIVGIRFF